VRAGGWRRLQAWGIDCVAALLWAAALAGVVWPQRNRPLLLALSVHPALENLVGFAVLVLPVTIALAWAEHRWGTTPGKRLTGLHVIARSERSTPSARQALARNGVKVALPWAIGHAAVFLLVHDADVAGGAAAPGAPAIGLLLLSYVLPLVTVACVFARGRALHDVIADTEVVTGQ